MSRSIARTPSRALLEAFRIDRSRSTCPFAVSLSIKRSRQASQKRHASTTPAHLSEMEVEGSPRPRWAQTPPAMKAPVSSKPKPTTQQLFRTNHDPAKLDAMYDSLLGQDGHSLLSEETKWIAVTHKSFDQGRRGFNDRLAYLGKRIIELQLSLGILNAAQVSRVEKDFTDPHGREPFEHPALADLESLSSSRKSYLGHHSQFAKIAEKHNLQSVIRWQPKNPENLAKSGSDMVCAQAIFAIVGAVALERGGAIANQIVRERILRPLNLNANDGSQVDVSQ